MNFRFTAIAAGLFLAGSALAQIAPQAPAHVQPGMPASSTATAQPSSPPSAAPAPVKVDPAKEKAIRQLMDITGTGNLGNNMTEVVAEQVKSAMSRRLPADRLDKFMSDFNQKLNAKSPASQVDEAQVPIYAQHFSLEELQGMIQFYQSPVGQQMVKQLPNVLHESQVQGAVIERKAALDTLKDMSNDYPELKPMLGPPEQKPQGSQPPGSLKPKQPQPQSQQPQSQPSKPQQR